MGRVLVATCSLALAGCLSLPTPRPVRPGEVVELEAVSVRLPAEPGWTFRHVQVQRDQYLSLAHADPSGEIDRQAEVAQSAGTPGFVSFMERREGPGALVVKPAGAGAERPEGPRYGVLSARLDFHVEPAPSPGGVGRPRDAGTYSTWIFAAPRRMAPGYRVSYYERDSAQEGSAAGADRDRAHRAEGFFDSVRLREASDGSVAPTPPQLVVRPALGLTLGGAGFRLRGESFAGVDERFSVGLDRLEPGKGRGAGWEAGVRALAARRGDLAAAYVALTPSAFLCWGPARLRAGVDLGYAAAEDRTTLERWERAVVGGSLGASIEVHRGERLDWLIEAEASAGSQRFQAAGMRAGVRLH